VGRGRKRQRPNFRQYPAFRRDGLSGTTETRQIGRTPHRDVTTVESSWNVMAHGDAREPKWRGNWRLAWVASTLHTTSEHGVSSITTNNKTWCAHLGLPVVDWTDAPADINGLVRFAERRNLVSARVPSRFNWPLASVWWTVLKFLLVCHLSRVPSDNAVAQLP